MQGPVGPRPLLAGLLIVLTVWACGGEDSTGLGQQLASSVVVTPSTAFLSLGEEVLFTGNAQDASGNTILGKTFTWSSSDESIATVTDFGRVTALTNGSVTVTAATDGVEGTAVIEAGRHPLARAFHAIAYDAESDRVILFGGDSGPRRFQGTSAYDLGTNTWTAMNPATRPVHRVSHGMAYDAQSDRVILFGGFGSGIGSGILSDTWAYDFNTNSWTDMNPISRPAGRFAHKMVYDARSDRIILFGGDGGPIMYDETWAYDFDRNAWTQLSPSTKPFGRVCLAMAYDAESGRVVVFGAETNAGLFDDTWAYDFNTNTWTELRPAVRPSVQAYQEMAYDPGSDRAILFGGAGGAETWAYDFNTNTWTHME